MSELPRVGVGVRFLPTLLPPEGHGNFFLGRKRTYRCQGFSRRPDLAWDKLDSAVALILFVIVFVFVSLTLHAGEQRGAS